MNSFFASVSLGAVVFAAGFASGPVVAGPADTAAELDLLPGWTTESGRHMAALRIQLQPGWKTYWRAPGEGGIAPVFDWSGSKNLSEVRVHWPAPEIFVDYGMTTLGFEHELVLPVELTPRVDGEPVHLSVDIALGVCSDICIPATLTTAGVASVPAVDGAPAIHAALDQRPKTAKPGQTVTCELEPIDDGLRLHASIPVSAQPGDQVVVFETPRSDLWISPPKTERSGKSLIAVSEMVPPEAKPFAFDRSGLRTTVIGPAGATELMGCVAG